MDNQTLAALKGSIRKWENIVAGTGVDKGVFNCPLCELFWDDDCTGCPVSERTGLMNCRGTPYNMWEALTKRDDATHGDPERIAAAQAELDFLRSLLPRYDHVAV
jgi:hypothetical protein